MADISDSPVPTGDTTRPGMHVPAFMLSGPDGDLVATGIGRRLERGPLATLNQRVDTFFSRRDEADPAPALLVGSLPFDPQARDLLHQPQTLAWAGSPGRAPFPPAGSPWTVRCEPGVEDYKHAVRRALASIDAARRAGDALEKVVLSRSLVLGAPGPIDPVALFRRLGGDPSVTRFAAPLIDDAAGAPRFLVGATPELLVSRTGERVSSFPLAGSLPRSADPIADRAAAAALEKSDKDQREHALVVESIADRLAPFCAELSVPAVPGVHGTRTMWHLGTRIAGRLKRPEETSSAALAAALHPTPAVGGTPRDRALDVIREIEGYDRGFYAGAVGWTDVSGDGNWYVSLRCAEISGSQARIYAGAGIVAGSDPDAEAAETSAKFRAMLDAFGIDEAGKPCADTAMRSVA